MSSSVESQTCAACGEDMWSPLGCEACGALAAGGTIPGAFEVFGLEPSWELDRKDLRRRMLRLQRLTHPDHAGAHEAAELASAAVNHAHEVLADDFLRADDLLQRLGAPSESAERQMPQEFLLEVLEWNETLDDASITPAGSPEREALAQLSQQLQGERERILGEIGEALSPLPSPGDALLPSLRRRLNAVRYLARALWRIRELRLAEASGSPQRPPL